MDHQPRRRRKAVDAIIQCYYTIGCWRLFFFLSFYYFFLSSSTPTTPRRHYIRLHGRLYTHRQLCLRVYYNIIQVHNIIICVYRRRRALLYIIYYYYYYYVMIILYCAVYVCPYRFYILYILSHDGGDQFN